MILSEHYFNLLKESIKPITICLDWEDHEGKAELDRTEIECTGFVFFLSCKVTETGVVDTGDYWTSPSFTSNGFQIEDFSFEVYDEPTDEQIFFTEKQQEELCKQIISLTSTTS